MGLFDSSAKPQQTVDGSAHVLNSTELELLLNTLSNSVIQLRGKDLQVLYGLIVKLQQQYNNTKK